MTDSDQRSMCDVCHGSNETTGDDFMHFIRQRSACFMLVVKVIYVLFIEEAALRRHDTGLETNNVPFIDHTASASRLAAF